MDQPIAQKAGFWIGPYEIRPERNLIAGPERKVRVEPKAMQVLTVLAEARGHTVTRESLIEAVWPRGFVTDDVLTRSIGQLRRALDENARNPRYLETIPKQGYRLKHPDLPSQGDGAIAPARSSTDQGLVVLPFQNLSGQSDDDYIADGMTELLICRLAGLLRARVISRTTAMQFKPARETVPEIAARLNVRWVVEGSVLTSGDQLQVVVQLVDGNTDAHLWSQSYLRDLTDLLVLQNEIAASVAQQVQRETRDPGAESDLPALPESCLRDYLKGRHLLSRRNLASLQTAESCLARVNADAPDFADGWASRAEALLMLMHYGARDVQGTLDETRLLLSRALELNPESPIARSCRGGIRLFFQRDPGGAQADIKRALHVMPNYSVALLTMANICSIRGENARAIRWLERALEVEPLDLGINMNLGDHLILHRRYDEAAQQLQKTLELSPQHQPSRLRLAWALALGGHRGAAKQALDLALEHGGANAACLEHAALVAACCGDDARKHLESLQALAQEQFVSAWSLARTAAAAKDHELTAAYLEKAIAEQTSSLVFFAVTPAFDHFRNTPQGRSIAHQLNLPGVVGSE